MTQLSSQVFPPSGEYSCSQRAESAVELRHLAGRFEPPADFDLAGHWRSHLVGFHSRLHTGEAVVRLSPRGVARVRERLGHVADRAVTESGVVEADGWTRAVLPIESLDHAHGEFLRLAADLEVLEPPGLRNRYGHRPRTGRPVPRSGRREVTLTVRPPCLTLRPPCLTARPPCPGHSFRSGTSRISQAGRQQEGPGPGGRPGRSGGGRAQHHPGQRL